MKRLTLHTSCLLVVLFAIPASAARPVTLDDILKYRNVTEVQIALDGKRAAFVVSEADFDENLLRTNIHVVDAAGKSTIRLTSGSRRDDTPRWSPDGNWIAFLSEREGKPKKKEKDENEKPRKQIWIISPAGGEARQLTSGNFAVSALAWSPDGARIAFVATEGPSEDEQKRKKDKDDALVVDSDIKRGRLHIVSVADGKTEELTGADRHVTALSFSPRGDEIAFADQPTPKVPDEFNSVVRVIDVATRRVRELAGGDTTNRSPRWSPDGKWIAFEATSRTDWAANSWIHVAPAAGGASRSVTQANDEEIVQFEWAEDSAGLYFVARKRVDQNVWRVGLDGKLTAVDSRPGVAREIAVAAGTMAWVHESPTEPADVWFATLKPARRVLGLGPAPRKVTDLNAYVAELALGKTQVVTWKNKTDSMDMEGLLVTPPGDTPGKPRPLLVVVHGGPAGVFQSTLSLRRGAYPIQAFASQGYVIFQPNPRGSGGYGEVFRKANVKDWGYADYRDIQDGVDELVARGVADKDRMGVMGWSYGGYMTSWTITQTSRFKAASVGAGVTNLFSMYGTTDIPPFQESYFGVPPWQDRELYARHSAMSFVDKVTTPTLIQHGAEDRRVPLSQGEELYTALRARGVATEMVKYPRTPHGIQEPKLIRDAMMRNLEWFDRYVMGNASAAKWHAPPAGPKPQ
jgi:dipeptidyl aminopeptidase/acylaminoacyl peptidase